jgi:hypothetical protein
VEGGVVNGSTGILRQVRYFLDAEGNRHLKSCIVQIDDAACEALPHLPPKFMAVLADTSDLTFAHQQSHKKCVIKRTQVPIMPAFAMTAHKAQGQTLSKVIVDLQGCSGSESPYVMVSRVTSLSGLAILRPFTFAKISCRLSEDTRRELDRLQTLRLKTIVDVGTPEEIAIAKDWLQSPEHRSPCSMTALSMGQPNEVLTRFQAAHDAAPTTQPRTRKRQRPSSVPALPISHHEESTTTSPIVPRPHAVKRVRLIVNDPNKPNQPSQSIDHGRISPSTHAIPISDHTHHTAFDTNARPRIIKRVRLIVEDPNCQLRKRPRRQ